MPADVSQVAKPGPGPAAVAPVRGELSAGGNNLPAIMFTRAPMILADRPMGAATPDDMAVINTMALQDLDPGDVYILVTESSNRQIDAYYTRMLPQTLANFVEDATAGVAFCDSHVQQRLPMGRTFGGAVATVERLDGSTDQVAYLLTYMLRGLALSNGLNTDDVIRGISGGIYKDISVGFKPLAFWCSICHLNMLSDWSCNHWPGQTYDTDQGEVLCLADVLARLAEHSLVYEGATPNAMVLKAQRELDLGRANTRQVSFVEDHCRVLLVPRYSGYDLATAAQRDLDHQVVISNATAPLPIATNTQGGGYTAPTFAAPATPNRAQIAAPATPPEEEADMRGSEMVERFLDTYLAQRVGKEVSAANIQTLRDAATKMRAGHDTMAEGLDVLARFVSDKEAAGNGTSEPPQSEPGAGEDEGDQGADHTEKVQTGGQSDGSGHGVDEADAHPPISLEDVAATGDPAKDRAATSPNPPGTDDGDGDEDQPTRDASLATWAPEITAAIRGHLEAGETAEAQRLILAELDQANRDAGEAGEAGDAGVAGEAAASAEGDRAQAIGAQPDPGAPDPALQDEADEDEGIPPAASAAEAEARAAKSGEDEEAETEYDDGKPFPGAAEPFDEEDGGRAADPPAEDGEDNETGGQADKAPKGAKRDLVPALLGATSTSRADALAVRLDPETAALVAEARAVRTTLLEDTIRAGIRALGADFDEASYRRLFAGATLGQLQAARENFQLVARVLFSPHGVPEADPTSPTGYRWTTEPTLAGGRQTMAQDPNDPTGLYTGGAASRFASPGGVVPAGPAKRNATTARSGDVSLYRAGAGSRRGRPGR